MNLRAFPPTALALLAAGSLAACGGNGHDGAAPKADAATVQVKTFSFNPDPIRVPSGTKVTWRNADATAHTVTSGQRNKPDGEVNGRLAESGGEFSTTFDKPGTYAYFCSLHSGPGMEATVIVE